MEDLILSKQTMSSIEISELTGKEHKHVMRDIRVLLCQGVHQSNFGLMFRITKLGNGAERKDPYYELTKKGCLILASGYDAKLRERIIDRWEELENEKRNGGFQVPTSFKEALLLAAHQQELIEQQQRQIEQKQEVIDLQQSEIAKSAPKVSYYDTTLQSVNTMTSTQVAKQIGMDAEKLHKKLKEAGIIFRQSGQWLLHSPYDKWGLHATRTQTYTRSDGSTGTSTYTVWTEKGRRFIIALHDNAWNVRKAVKQIKGETEKAA